MARKQITYRKQMRTKTLQKVRQLRWQRTISEDERKQKPKTMR